MTSMEVHLVLAEVLRLVVATALQNFPAEPGLVPACVAKEALTHTLVFIAA